MADQSSDYEELKNEFAQLKADVQKIASTLGQSARDRTAHAADDIRAAARAARAEGARIEAAAEDVVKERPITSVLVAFVAGVVLAKLLDR
jgi:ElaB/YqjD/DUF883 family membrane-anchored ribosome-binding protein